MPKAIQLARSRGEDDWSEKDWYIDPYLWNSLVKDIELDFYVFPYIVSVGFCVDISIQFKEFNCWIIW